MSWVLRADSGEACCSSGPLPLMGTSRTPCTSNLRICRLSHHNMIHDWCEGRYRQRLCSCPTEQAIHVQTGVPCLAPRMAARITFALKAHIATTIGGCSKYYQAHLLVPKANLAARCRGNKLGLLADRARGYGTLVCLFDAACQHQAEPTGLLAVNHYSPVDPHRHNLSRSRAHDQ